MYTDSHLTQSQTNRAYRSSFDNPRSIQQNAVRIASSVITSIAR